MFIKGGKRMKKLLLCALSLLAAVLMIAGCGGGDKTGSGQNGKISGKAYEHCPVLVG